MVILGTLAAMVPHRSPLLRRMGRRSVAEAWMHTVVPSSSFTTARTARISLLFHQRTLAPRRWLSSSHEAASLPVAPPQQQPTTRTTSTTDSSSAIPRIVLKRNVQSRAFRDGNPLIYKKSVTHAAGQLRTGDVVHVCVERESASAKASKSAAAAPLTHPPSSPQTAPIGFGIYNAHSLYSIRLLCHATLQPVLYKNLCQYIQESDASAASPERLVEMLLAHQVGAAVRLRRTLGCTDTFRLLNGEGDGLSGLAVDVIGGTHLVVMSSAAWCQKYRAIIERVLRQEYTAASVEPGVALNVIWKTAPSRLAQDGFFLTVNSATSSASAQENDMDVDDDDVLVGESQLGEADHPMVLSTENGILFETYPTADGQKTGVYSDQRHNRLMMAQYCPNQRVLDLCCYTGGFSLNALVHGNAAHCTAVDSSAAAIAAATANAQRNGIDPQRYTFRQMDVTAFLQQSVKRQEFYDVVILDPPKFAPSVKLLDKAKRKYHALNRDAIAVIDPTKGGLLLSCTCSAAMTQAEGGQVFLKMVSTAAQAAGRQVTLLSVHGAAPCHTQSPMAFPASSYLTAALFFVHPKESL